MTSLLKDILRFDFKKFENIKFYFNSKAVQRYKTIKNLRNKIWFTVKNKTILNNVEI